MDPLLVAAVGAMAGRVSVVVVLGSAGRRRFESLMVIFVRWWCW